MDGSIVSADPSVIIRNLSVLAYAQGFTLWHYRLGKVALDGQQTPNTVLERGFWHDAADMLAVGDQIIVSGAHGAVTLHVASTDNGVLVLPLLATAP